jgi:alpha-beta hydrolase superfamily lysophospholipase
MTTADDLTRDPMRLGAALKLVLRRYGRQIRRRPAIAMPALILPGTADALIRTKCATTDRRRS